MIHAAENMKEVNYALSHTMKQLHQVYSNSMMQAATESFTDTQVNKTVCSNGRTPAAAHTEEMNCVYCSKQQTEWISLLSATPANTVAGMVNYEYFTIV